MKRRSFVYLFISLTMVSLVFGSLPFAAAETSIVPAGITETFTPVPPTETPTPTETPAPTNTPTLTTTPTPTEMPASTNTPGPTETPAPIPESTPTAPAVVGLPDTGGAAPRGGASPLIPVLIAGILGTLAFALSVSYYRLKLQRQEAAGQEQ